MRPTNVRAVGVRAALRRAQDAFERAAGAARTAERHERHERHASADRSGLREFHLRMAAKYREIETLHRASATLQAGYARRLVQWQDPSARSEHDPVRPLFMAAVAEASGGDSAVLALRVQGHVDAVTTASDRTASAAQNLESEFREGPGHDAIRTRVLVSAVDQAIPKQWPSYGPDLAELGVRAVVAVPLMVAAECLGALTVFGEPPICASAGVERLRTVADVLIQSVLLEPDSTTVGDDGVPYFPALEEGGEWPVVHQAAGMLAARNGCEIADALAMLRAHAFAESVSIPSVAERIVRRELVLPED